MDEFEFDGESTAFKDFFTNLASIFIICVGVLLLHINPVAKNESAEITSPGQLMVEVIWPPDLNVDVDTWLLAPTEPKPVGYSNKAGKIWNLLRDDVGFANDISGLNYENAYTRGIPPGEYVVNIHMYSDSPKWPVPVTVIVSKKEPDGANKQIIAAKLELDREKQEKTVVRFRIEKDGSLNQGSVNNRLRKLIGGKD